MQLSSTTIKTCTDTWLHLAVKLDKHCNIDLQIQYCLHVLQCTRGRSKELQGNLTQEVNFGFLNPHPLPVKQILYIFIIFILTKLIYLIKYFSMLLSS